MEEGKGGKIGTSNIITIKIKIKQNNHVDFICQLYLNKALKSDKNLYFLYFLF